MKKLLIILFLFAPLLANAQSWFKVNAVRVSENNKYSEWQKSNARVFMSDDMKVKIYAEETHTIRALQSSAEEYTDKSGISGMFWQAVDENGNKCIVNIQSDQKSYIHLILTFIDDNFVICYNLIPDN